MISSNENHEDGVVELGPPASPAPGLWLVHWYFILCCFCCSSRLICFGIIVLGVVNFLLIFK